VHDEPIGGADFATRVPSLQLDRCILSRTRFEIPIIRAQEYMQTSFPPNTRRCTLIVRLERKMQNNTSINDAYEKGSEEMHGDDIDDDDATHLLRLQRTSEVVEGKRNNIGDRAASQQKGKKIPSSDLALSCTVVFRGGTSKYGLNTMTCRCVLPFDKMARQISLVQGKGNSSFEDPMEVVRRGRRDDLVESVVRRLRLCMLDEGKFARAVSMDEVRSGKNELQLLFDWQKPRRDLLVGDPIEDNIVKFLQPHQREMIRIYRERQQLVSILPTQPPPEKENENEEMKNRLQEAENAALEVIRRESAAVKVQSMARRKMAYELVSEIRSDAKIALEEVADEEVEVDSDVEDGVVLEDLLYQIKFVSFLNSKLVSCRFRVFQTVQIASSKNKNKNGGKQKKKNTEKTTMLVHVKVVEPKSNNVARVSTVVSQDEMSVQETKGHVAALEDPENPFHEDVSRKGGEMNVRNAAVLASNIFEKLRLFQSRAKGILLLRLMEEEEEEQQVGEKKGEAGAGVRRPSEVEASSLQHSPMMVSSPSERKSGVVGANDALPPVPKPSAPKASRGKPFSLNDYQSPREEEEEEIVPLEVLIASASKNWKPDDVPVPSGVTPLKLKRLKYKNGR
jgi:hypothetical protein